MEGNIKMNRSLIQPWIELPLLFGLLFAVVGCTGQAYEVLTEKSMVDYIKDVPVPRGFKRNESESRSESFPDKNIRDIDYVFTGNAHKMATKQFYEKQMPLYRWGEPVSVSVSQGRIRMIYIKDQEECDITMEERNFLGGTKLSISVKSKKK